MNNPSGLDHPESIASTAIGMIYLGCTWEGGIISIQSNFTQEETLDDNLGIIASTRGSLYIILRVMSTHQSSIISSTAGGRNQSESHHVSMGVRVVVCRVSRCG